MQRLSFLRVFVVLAFLCSIMPVYSAPPAIDASATPGAINAHDMMMIKEKQRMKQEKEDYKQFKERKESKNYKKPATYVEPEEGTNEKVFNQSTSNLIKEKKEKSTKLKKEKKETLFNKGEIKKQENLFPVNEVTAEKKSFFKKKKSTEPDVAEVADAYQEENIIPVNDSSTSNAIKGGAEKSGLGLTTYVESIRINTSGILSDEEIQNIFDSVLGQNVTFGELESVVNEINRLYAEKGYVTARAFLPPQTIEDGVVRITLIEGVAGNIAIENNHWTKDSYIRQRISQREGDLFEISVLEQDVVTFNRYNEGVKLRASLAPGEEVATTDIKLQAEEKFPFHVVGLMDNAGRKTIGELRGGLMAYADSLFGYRDRLSLGAYASQYSVTPFADYNIPVNKYDGRVGFTFSSSYSDIGEGPYKMFNIQGRSYNYSLYYTHPLIRKPNFELTSYSAVNYKQASTLFDGYTLYTDKVTSFETSLNARYDSKRGIWYASQGVYQAFPIISDASKYFKYTGGLIRLHDFGKGVVGQFRASYQWVPTDVIPYVDQFQGGGIATVRGYSEGLLIGKSGYILSGELMFPILPQKITLNRNGEKATFPFLGKYIKAVAFMDHAGIMPYKRNPRFHFELSLAPDFDAILRMKKSRQEEKEAL